MAYYAYKDMASRIPQSIIDSIENYDHSADYDGDLWIAASLYCDKLEAEIKRLRRGEFTLEEIAALPFSIRLRNEIRKEMRK